MPLHAVILAAGYGRRMRPLSDETHKALLPVGGTTILGRIVDGLAAVGVDDVTVVTGYRADDVRAFLEAHAPGLAVRYVHNARYEATNNIVSLNLALAALPLDRDVLVIECDLLFDPEVLARLMAAPGGNVALVDRYRAGMDGTVVAVEDGVITQVYPPHLQGPRFDYHGTFKTLNVYRFDRAFCRDVFRPLLDCYATLIDGNCYYELVLGMLVNMQRHRIHALQVDGLRWVEVDDPNDLAVARFQFEPDARADVLDRLQGGHWNLDLLDFAFMRNAHFPTDAMIAAMRQALPALLASYGSTQAVLNEKLAWHLGVRADRVQVLHGATQFYPILRRMAGGRPVLAPAPTFGEYARMFPDATTYADAPGIDLDALAAGCTPGRIVVIVSPNSPTGTVVPTAWIHAQAAAHPDVWFVVDESFAAFADEEPLVARLERAPLPNVLVLTSLSKSLGVPGLRLGYVYANDERAIRAIGEEIPIWNLSAPAEFYLELLLKFRQDLDASLERTREDRARFAHALASLDAVARVHPSGGNFLLVDLAPEWRDTAAVRRALLARGIEVKDVSDRFVPRVPRLRLAVRVDADHARLIEALAQVTGAGPEALS